MSRHLVVYGLLLVSVALLALGCSSNSSTEPAPTTQAVITAPATGDSLSALEPVVMEGYGLSAGGIPIPPNLLEWFVDEVDSLNLIGTGFSQSATIPPGDHTIFLRAWESINLNAVTSVAIHVKDPGNFPPVARLVEPFDGEDFLPAHVITVLHGQGTDQEDGELGDAALSWRSSIDGDLGTGRFLNARLSPGDHQLILTATDADGATHADTVSVTLRHRPASPIADGTFFFGASSFVELCADKKIDWLVGDCRIDVIEGTDLADLYIDEMSGTISCDVADICELTGEQLQGNIWTFAEAPWNGGTLRMEISVFLAEPTEAQGLIRVIEAPADADTCVNRSLIRLGLQTY
jgi:hypothetical protein